MKKAIIKDRKGNKIKVWLLGGRKQIQRRPQVGNKLKDDPGLKIFLVKQIYMYVAPDMYMELPCCLHYFRSYTPNKTSSFRLLLWSIFYATCNKVYMESSVPTSKRVARKVFEQQNYWVHSHFIGQNPSIYVHELDTLRLHHVNTHRQIIQTKALH